MKIHLFVLVIFLIAFVYADKEKEDPCKGLTFDRTICNNILKCVYDDDLKKCVLNKKL